MSAAFRELSWSALSGLAEALSAGRLRAPYARSAVAYHVPPEHLDAVAGALRELDADGMEARHIGRMLQLLADERAERQVMNDRVQLVWSPPDHDHVDARDTAAVVQELFQLATTSILLATYSLDKGDKAVALFGALAERMDKNPDLAVRFCVNIKRKEYDERPKETLVKQFVKEFREQIWPGQRYPEVFHDPRSLSLDWSERASLHAKCVIADRRYTLLTSANFSEAAGMRNIEAGVRVDDIRLAERVTRQFDNLIESEVLQAIAV